MVRYLVVLGLLCWGGVARAQGIANLIEHVPASVCLALTSSDVGQTCAEFQQTRIGQSLTGPNFTPLIEELRRRQLGGPLNLRPVVGFDWIELEQVHQPGGLFVFPLPEGKLGLAWLFVGTPSSDGPLAAAARYFGEQGFRGENVTNRGTSLTTLHPPAVKKNESSRVLLAAQGFYGVANSPEAADALLKVEPKDSLAADSIWQQSAVSGTTAAPLPGDVRLLVRPMQLWDLARSANPEPEATSEQAADEPARDPLASSRQLGFDGIHAVVGQITFPASGARDWEISARLVAPRPFAKALRLLELQSGNMPELPEFIPADVTSASFWKWDFPTAMKGFGNLFDEANEPGPDGVGLFEDMLDGLRDDPEGVQVDLRRDVFANLGPDILNLTDQRGPKTEELPQGDRTLYVAVVRDLPTVAAALTHFYQGDDRVKHEKENGYDLWTVPEGASLFVEGESDSVVSVRALALGEGRLLFGTDEQLLRTTLAGGAQSHRLKDDPAWTQLWQAMKERGGETGASWSLTRLDDVLAPGYVQATSARQPDATSEETSGGLLSGLWQILLFGTANEETDVPIGAAPDFNTLRPSLPPTSAVFTSADSGWNVTISALRREE